MEYRKKRKLVLKAFSQMLVFVLVLTWVFSGWPQIISYTNQANEVQTFPPGIDQVSANTLSTFRVTEYFLSAGQFTGATFTLTLNQNLNSNYFAIIQGSDGIGGSTGNRGPDKNYVSVTADPNGTGDLVATTNPDELGLTRGAVTNDWFGTITVVECLVDCTNSGFQLLDVQRVVHSAASTSGTDTSGTGWSDINQVTLFGGFNGSGCDTATSQVGRMVTCWARFNPSSTATINWTRDGTGGTLGAATSTVMVVEWGSEWTIQRVNVAGSNGGNGADITGEYDTATITSVVRDNTWVWGTCTSVDNDIGSGAEGFLITLGDGVTQNASETSVAVGSEFTVTKDCDVYIHTHPDLATDYRFKTDGDSTALTVDVTVDSATSNRMALSYNGSNGTANTYPRPIWSARYFSNTSVRLERRRHGEPFPAWVQGIDYSAIQSPSYEQSGFRLFANADSTDVGSPLALNNTNFTLATSGDAFRLRFLMHIAQAELPLNGNTFKLQYVGKGSGTCASPTGGTPSTYTDVTAATVLAYNNNATPSDGDNLTGNVNDPTHSSDTINDQDYEELNNFTNSVSAIPENEDGMWDFSLIDNTAPTAKTFCFRMVESDGTVLDTYSQFPEVTSANGGLSVDIVNSGGTPVASPTVAFSTLSLGFSFQTTTGTLGISSERIRITNNSASAQWNLTMAATGGTTAFWDGVSSDFDFNDSTASAGDGGDADSLGGQLTIDAATNGVITPEGGCTNTGITLGSSAAFDEGTTDSITLLTAGASADTGCFWDLTAIDLSQTVPEEQGSDAYDINMTVTIVAV